ncbi:MAG TPA: hypothetical protein PLI09_27975 [Candidatus Hydrogenedentes bacterium]|nr:hypothetical protein [Candidatus Hydrogenedentota bacterium]
MQIKIFSLPYNPALGGFDDEPLRQFLVDKEVLSIAPQFFLKDGVPHAGGVGKT